MNRLQIALIGPALICLLSASVANATEPPLLGGGAVQTVVLRNGRVLQGHVTRRDERLEVSGSGQSVIRVPVKLVDFVAPDMTTAYTHQSERIKDNDIDSRIRLVEWCLQNGLTNAAAEQYAVIKYLDSDHPKFAYLTRRMELTRRKQTMKQIARSDQAAAETKARPVTPAELSRFTKEMPPGTVEQFTHVVQPMIINRCGATACHGVLSDNPYQLVRPSIAGAFSHRYTQRNLHATVQQIRKGRLADSAWISAATRPHGGLQKPLFGEKEIDNLQNLVSWARSVGPAPKRLDVAAIAAAQLAAPVKKTRRDGGVRQASYAQPADNDTRQATRDNDRVDHRSQGGAGGKQQGATADPFDPGDFNNKK